MIRVTGGDLRGRVIKVIDSESLRPTTSFFREWIFSVLRNYVDIDDTNVLDLFSGSGITGIEFISRGSSTCTFIEGSMKVKKQLEKNLEILSLDDQSRVIKSDAIQFVSKAVKTSFNYDIVFMDAPYDLDASNTIIRYLGKGIEKKIVSKDLILVIETDRSYQVESGNYFTVLREKQSGKSKVTILEVNQDIV